MNILGSFVSSSVYFDRERVYLFIWILFSVRYFAQLGLRQLGFQVPIHCRAMCLLCLQNFGHVPKHVSSLSPSRFLDVTFMQCTAKEVLAKNFQCNCNIALFCGGGCNVKHNYFSQNLFAVKSMSCIAEIFLQRILFRVAKSCFWQTVLVQSLSKLMQVSKAESGCSNFIIKINAAIPLQAGANLTSQCLSKLAQFSRLSSLESVNTKSQFLLGSSGLNFLEKLEHPNQRTPSSLVYLRFSLINLSLINRHRETGFISTRNRSKNSG